MAVLSTTPPNANEDPLDPLTGTLNRDQFRQRLEQALDEPEHHTALLLIAVADLHLIAQKHGEVARDEVMRQLGRTLLSFASDSISIARVDQAAFAAILRDIPPAQVSTLAADMRLKFAAQTIRAPHSGAVIDEISVSVGIASRLPCEPRERLMRRADAALGKATKKGSLVVAA
jgi:diguanylate cyclase (GGDEF)-like protein